MSIILMLLAKIYGNKQEWMKFFHPILLNFIHFVKEKFQFHSSHKFQTLIQNFDASLFEFEIANFQYLCYLATYPSK